MSRGKATLPPPKEELYELYVTQKQSYRQIMSHYQINAARAIKKWLIQYDIPIRHGSEAVKTQWANNNKRKSKQAEQWTTHGLSNTRLFRLWLGIKRRCYNPHEKEYKNYGGRGITICPEWQEFIPFYEWSMSNGYDKNAPRGQCTIDRIDNDKWYSPDNCRWVSQKVQSYNTRVNRWITFNGEKKTITQWEKITGIDERIIGARINNGWSVEKALTTPTKKANQPLNRTLI